LPSSLPLFIGKAVTNQGTKSDFWFDGSIDEVRVYRRALTEAEIQAAMNGKARG
jgi:hypothetical protein